MPNNTRIPICPYFRDEKNKSVSCEDVYRGFDSVARKCAWMDKYCDEWTWAECPYAKDLNEMYERIERGADMETEQMAQKIKAMSKELRYKATLLGRADKRLEAKEAEIKDLRKKNRRLEELREEEYKKRRQIETTLDRKSEKAAAQLTEVIKLYKGAMCYLLSKTPDGKVPEDEIKEWAKDKYYTVVRMCDEDGILKWMLDVQEVTDTDESNECEGIPGDDTEPEPETEEQQVQQC